MLRRCAIRLSPPTKMNHNQIVESLKSVPQWRKAPGSRDLIERKFAFKDFHEAWTFMSTMKPIIDKADHHPEWFNCYNRVDVQLGTHDCNGVSSKDFNLAKEMDAVAEKLKSPK